MDVSGVDLAIGAVVLPPIISFINFRHWPSSAKGLVALAVCFAYASIAMFMRDGELDIGQWRDTVISATAAALFFYHRWWQPTGIGPRLEAATTPRSSDNTPAARDRSATDYYANPGSSTDATP